MPTSGTKITALHLAVGSGNIENVKLLLERKADLNKTTSQGNTPIFNCLTVTPIEKAKQMLELLLSVGANINKIDDSGATLYDVAQSNNQYELCIFLLQKGALPVGTPANNIGIDSFHLENYYQIGDVPAARTRAAHALVQNKFYIGGGLKLGTVEQLEELLAQEMEDDEVEPSGLIPCSDLYMADLSKVQILPLVTLSKIKNEMSPKFKFCTEPMGEYLIVDQLSVKVEYVFETDSQEKTENQEKTEIVPENVPENQNKEVPEFHSSIYASESHSKEQSLLAYYEIKIVDSSKNPIVSVGWTAQPGEWNFERHPGWLPDSIGYHSDDGKIRTHNFSVDDNVDEEEIGSLGSIFGCGDIVGAGYIFETNQTFFTLNGQFLGVYSIAPEFTTDSLRAVIGFGTNQTKIEANFGSRPFLFNFHIPTISWTKLNDLPINILTIFPLPDSPETLLIVSESLNTAFHYNTITHQVSVIECKPGKVKEIPSHFEHFTHLVGNKLILFCSLENLIDPGNRKAPVLFSLNLLDYTWTDILAPSGLANKKLSKALSDIKTPLSTTVIGGNYYIFTPEKAYMLNFDTLHLQAIKLTGLVPSADLNFSSLDSTKALCSSLNLTHYGYNLIDISLKKWFLPQFTGFSQEASFGKSMQAYEDKIFVFSGISNQSDGEPSNSLSSISTHSFDYSFGLSNAFNDPKFSDYTVKHGEMTYYLHKSILSCRSSYFHKILENNPNQTTHELTQTWDSKNTMAVLKYLYSDSIDVKLATSQSLSTISEITKILVPEHHDRIVEFILFSKVLTSSTLGKDLLTSLDTKNYSDISIESVSAHRVVLSTRSSTFKKILDSGDVTSIQEHPQTLLKAIQYLYDPAGFTLINENWDDLLSFAKKMDLVELERIVITAKETVTSDFIPTAE